MRFNDNYSDNNSGSYCSSYYYTVAIKAAMGALLRAAIASIRRE